MKISCQNQCYRVSPATPRWVVTALTCVVLGTIASPRAAAQQADPACGNPFVVPHGPYDYLVEHGAKRKVVEDHHFTPRVESLVAGQSTVNIAGDLAFTLRVFPNHHRALMSMMKLGAKLKSPRPPGAEFSVECYFKRAILFRPEDSVSRMIYAKYLGNNSRIPDGIAQLEYVTQQSPDNAFTQYNAGLIYVELREFDRALIQAHRAMGLGFERTGLKQQLQAAGKWADAAPADLASSAGAATAPAAPASSASAASNAPR